MTPPTATGIARTVQEVADHARALVRLEAELASIELREKAARLGGGAALIVGAVLLGLFALGFALSTIAAALATFLPTWLALLLVTIGLVLAALIAALIGRGLVRRAGPPLPDQALDEARATGAALRGNGRA